MHKLMAILTLLSNCLMTRAYYSDHQAYLNKLISQPQNIEKTFVDYDNQNNFSIKNWLEKVDRQLNPQIFNYRGDFKFQLSQDGSIKTLAIDKLEEDDLVKFKSFLNNLLALRLPILPKDISEDTIFDLDGDLLYIRRKFHETLLKTGFTSLASSESVLKNTIDELKLKRELKLKLIKPNFLDYPNLGEELVFQDHNDLFFYAYVEELSKREIKLKFYKVANDKNSMATDLAFKVERPKENSQISCNVVLSSGFAAGSQIGVGNAIASYGVIPGALTVLGMFGATLQEFETEKSYSFGRGDLVSMVSSGKEEIQ